MLASAANAQLYMQWRSHIDAEETRDAFALLVGLAACLVEYTCHPQWKGEIRDFRFIGQQNEQSFSFITNKEWLLFYFRAPAVGSGRHTLEEIRTAFDSASENSRGEWTVRIHTIADVHNLWCILALV